MAIAINGAAIRIRGRAWTRRTVQIGLAVGVHDAEVVFCVLIQVFSRDPVTAGSRFASERDVAFENLVCIAPDLYIWTITIKGLNSMGHPRAVVVRIIAIVAAARAFIWSWSHDTCLIPVNTSDLGPAGAFP